MVARHQSYLRSHCPYNISGAASIYWTNYHSLWPWWGSHCHHTHGSYNQSQFLFSSCFLHWTHSCRENQEMIGCLMYTAIMTCPDISFTVSSLSQYLNAPCTTHLQAVTRVFRYLSGTKDLKLILGGLKPSIHGYSNSDWASQAHRHSISGFTFIIGMGVVSWSSKKQPIVTLSSTEAKYVALTHCSKNIIWIHKLLKEFLSILKSTLPTTLFCNNQGMIWLSKDSTFHRRTKHIDVHFHFIHQTVSQGHISIIYCPTDDMIADTFTKPLACVKFKKFHQLLGIIWSCLLLEGECWYMFYFILFVGHYSFITAWASPLSVSILHLSFYYYNKSFFSFLLSQGVFTCSQLFTVYFPLSTFLFYVKAQ